MAHVPQSQFPDIVWPALTEGSKANTLAVLAQLLQSQWWPPEELRRWQLRQAHEVIRSAKDLPHIKAAAAEANWRPDRPLDDATWQRWPILTRERARDLGDALFPAQTPKAHGQVGRDATSGSTGTPLNVRRTELFSFMYQAIGVREMLWHDRDVRQTYALIKHVPSLDAKYPHGARLENWGGAAANLYATGPAVVLDIKTPIDQMARWVRQVAPGYLNTFPSAIDSILDEFTKHGWPAPPLRAVRTQGETVTPALRRKVRSAWGVPITDCYSAEEVGYIAHQSPGDENQLLVAAETTIVEILDDRNRPCGVGEVGRVVVTPLHNFAMPLVRYEIGDYAEVGAASPCGRGLPVLKRVLGRARARIRLPDGSLRFAYNPSDVFAVIAAVRQYQIVQTKPDRLTVRLVARRALETGEARLIETGLAESFGYPFPIDWEYVESIARAAGGKFEDVRSELAP
ncbi:MAG: phenylacetate--CoA ligase family protein [Planctomycetes bacterium]|nr:phenylacetate--CoA ligase family protein [Planctomycetota bacterium]